jgi:hypothetical protein
MVEKYRVAHVEAQVAGRFLSAKPTQLKYILHLEQRIVPRGGARRLWRNHVWYLHQSRGMWLLAGGASQPMSRVKIGEKWSVRPERILTESETAKVLVP